MICGVSGATWAVQVEINPDPAVGNVKTYDGTPLTCDGGINVTDPSSGYTIRYGTTDGTYDLTTPPTRTEAGVSTIYYQITAENYDEKTGSYTCEVKVPGEVTLSEASGSIDYNQTKTITVTNNLSGGALSVVSSDDTIATAALNGSTITITPHSVGTVTITVISDANGNYTASSTTYTLNITQHYNITYVMGGGTNYVNAPTQYEYGVGATINGTPTKNGYVFGGWCTDSGLTDCAMIQTIGTDATGDKTFYALFGTQYNVSYSCGTGATGNAPANATVISNTAFTPAANTCSKADYIFNGWEISGTNTIVQPGNSFVWNYNSDKTLTAQWIEASFVIHTSSIESGSTFKFRLSASGTFNVNCGDGGVLSSDIGDVSGNTITRTNNTSETIYTCTYSTTGKKDVKFGGRATAYNSSCGDTAEQTVSTIRFTDNPGVVSGVTGSLGYVFPTLGQSNNQQPKFYQTFRESSLTSVPSNLFNGVTGNGSCMFRETFDRCAFLETVPSDLFSGIYGSAPHMFRSIFNLCTSMTSMPAGLFENVTGVAHSLFKYAFYGDTAMSGFIPPSTFAGLRANNSASPATNMFASMFTGNNNLRTKCPTGMETYTIGYENENGWAKKVSCSCSATSYYDGTTCEPCPPGYTADESIDKTSIDQCKIHCAAGTYIANPGDTTCSAVDFGYWAGASDVAYGSAGTRNKCDLGFTTPDENGTSEAACSISMVVCQGATYFDSDLERCVSCPPGYNSDTTDGKVSESECKIHCNAGTYIANAGDTTCTNVESGYWAAAANIGYGESDTRNQCPAGSTTNGTNNTSILSCLCSSTAYMNNGVCESCPPGYDDNSEPGKITVGQCLIHCEAGTYIHNQYDSSCSTVGIGFWAGASDTGYGETGQRTACESGKTTVSATSGSSSACITPQTICPANKFYDEIEDTCSDCPPGYDDNPNTGKTSVSQCLMECPAGTWPGAYIQKQYLQSDGASRQFIDTGYHITSDNIVVDVVVTSNSNISNNVDIGNMFGNQDRHSTGFSGSFKKQVFGLWHQGNGGIKLQSAAINPLVSGTMYNLHYTISGAHRTLQVNDAQEVYDDNASNTYNSEASFKVFSNGGSERDNNGDIIVTNTDTVFKGRIYSLKMWDNGNLILDLIPALRISDNALGMYNKVNSAFYPNIGGGTFTAPSANVGNGFAGTSCMNVGDGYYNGVNYTEYGSTGTRKQCPGGVATIVDGQHIDNATSISQCDGVSFFTCNPGYYLPANSNTCTICPINSYCIGGEYGSSDSEDQGLVSCPNNLFAPTGMWSSEQCGRKLHIGDNMLYLRSARKTTPSLNIDLNNDGIPDMFGNMTTQDVPITAGTQRKLKLQYNNATYSVYDDSVTVGE